MLEGLAPLLLGVLGLALGAAIAWGILQRRLGSVRSELAALRGMLRREREDALAELERLSKSRVLEAEHEVENHQIEQEAQIQVLRDSLLELEDTIEARRETLAERESTVERRESALERAEERLREQEANVSVELSRMRSELARVGALSPEAARAELVESITQEARAEAAERIAALEQEFESEASERAAVLIATAAHRLAAHFVAEKTVTVVSLPSDDMKGRIIGREGRNIRALESATGVDVIVDDTPEVVVLSGFSPLRREVARRALERLVEDGRIHPARIENVVEDVRAELHSGFLEEGQRLAVELGVGTLPSVLAEALGGLTLHVVAGQSLQAHAVEAVHVAGMMADELVVDGALARRVALFHVLGEVADHTVAGTSAEAAAELARRHGEKRPVVRALQSLAEGTPDTVVAVLVETAVRLSRARPGARRERLEHYVQRYEAMEALGRSFEGVEEVFVVQAGREVRVMVQFSKVDDSGCLLLARDIARAITQELTLPGEVRVTVVREGRATEVAR